MFKLSALTQHHIIAEVGYRQYVGIEKRSGLARTTRTQHEKRLTGKLCKLSIAALTLLRSNCRTARENTHQLACQHVDLTAR